MVTELLRLLRGGIAVGVATGRGKSVRQALRKALPKNYCDRVVVGYYNGGDVGLLSDKRPDGSPRAGEALAEIADALGSNQLLTHLAKLELRLPQITIEPNRQSQAEDVWALVENVVQALRVPGTSLLRSSHSIDVLAAGVGSGRPGSLLTLAPHRSGRAGSAASGSSTDGFAPRRRVPAGPGSQAMATAIPKAYLASSAIRCRDVETGPNLGVLAVFPSTGATCRCPLPSTGSRGLNSPASAVL